MKVLFIGLGSIGMKHARLIHENFPNFKLYSLITKNKHEVPWIRILLDWFEVRLINPDVAFICTPTYTHIPIAVNCALNKMHLFIEKPISESLDDLYRLIDSVLYNDLTAYVAYPFRFLDFPNFNSECHSFKIVCKTNGTKWMKPSYSFSRETGGGALLELSHEIDLAEHLFGKIKELIKLDVAYCMNIDIQTTLQAIHYNHLETIINLDIESQTEERYIEYKINTDSIINRFEYQISDDLYLKQLQYFFNNINNPKLINNLQEASELFKLMMEVHL